MFVNKKAFVLIITYLTAAVLVLSLNAALSAKSLGGYKSTAVYGYEHAFEETVTASDRLTNALKRAQFATGDEMSAAVLTDIYADCRGISMTMAALPFSTQELEKCAKFVSVVGDYAHTLLKQSAADGLDDTARGNFKKLGEISGEITGALSKLRDDVDNGTVKMDEPENLFAERDESGNVSSAMLKMESRLKKLPELVYDGEYTEAEPESAKNPVSEKTARAAAARFLGIEGDKLKREWRSRIGDTAFGLEDKSVLVDSFGNVISLSSSRTVTDKLSESELRENAKKFLQQKGFEGFEEVGAERMGNVLALTFYKRENGILRERDSLKIAVAADDGSVYSFDGKKHATAPKIVPLPQSTVSEETARKALTGVEVKSVQLLLTLTEGGREKLCYDFACKAPDGSAMHILVSADSGKMFAIRL